METRPTRASRTRFLYFIPVLFFVLGIVFNFIANSQLTPMGDFFWTGFLVLFPASILGGIIALGLYMWREAVARASRQSPQAQELSNRDPRGQRD